MEFGVQEYTLKQRIEEVQLCVKQQMWQAALVLALTIPDICGQIKFPSPTKRNRKGKENYIKWFHEYVEFHFADEKGLNQDGYAVNPYFTGVMCYNLRCAFLHCGNDDTDKISDEIGHEFTLVINACDSIKKNSADENSADENSADENSADENSADENSADENSADENSAGEVIEVRVDIANLCTHICDGALRFYEEWEKPQDFADRRCRWLDYGKWRESFQSSRLILIEKDIPGKT